MIKSPSDKRLTRKQPPMPQFVREVLEACELVDKYSARPRM